MALLEYLDWTWGITGWDKNPDDVFIGPGLSGNYRNFGHIIYSLKWWLKGSTCIVPGLGFLSLSHLRLAGSIQKCYFSGVDGSVAFHRIFWCSSVSCVEGHFVTVSCVEGHFVTVQQVSVELCTSKLRSGFKFRTGLNHRLFITLYRIISEIIFLLGKHLVLQRTSCIKVQ